MTCKPCAVARAMALNALLSADLLGNTLLPGDPRETISRRLARARLAVLSRRGRRWAAAGCAVLTWCSRRLGVDRDHCTWALDPAAPSIGSEIVHWSPVLGSPADPTAAPCP